MSDTYSDVDSSDDVVGAVAWQERIDAWPAIQSYKRRLDQLCCVRPIVDVGAGPGVDARRSGAVGVDRSWAMARRGRELGVPYVIGDVCNLPIGTETVGSLRCDRVIQHVADPKVAVRELARCVRRGGRLAIADPDQQTLTLSVPGVPRDLANRVRRLRRDIGYRSGKYVSALPTMLAALDFTEITVNAFPLVLQDSDDAFGIATWVESWGAQRGFTTEEARSWSRAVQSSKASGFLFAVTYFVVSGVRR